MLRYWRSGASIGSHVMSPGGHGRMASVGNFRRGLFGLPILRKWYAPPWSRATTLNGPRMEYDSLATVLWGAQLWTWTCARTKSPGWKVTGSRVVLTCSALVVWQSETKSFNISWANNTWWDTPSRYCTTDGARWRIGSIFALVMLVSSGKRNGRPTAGILRMMSVPLIGLLF